MNKTTVRIGFVPTYRRYGPIGAWCVKMRDEAMAAFEGVPGLEIVRLRPCPDSPTLIDGNRGYTPYGTVADLDEAEAAAEFFTQEKVDGLIIGALDFGDERSSAKVAEILRVPVLLYATKEPPVPEGPSMARVSDSYCGTLSIASALYRRGLPFHYAGIFFPQDPEFCQELEKFTRAIAVAKGLKRARIGQVGVRPGTFETVSYDETAMIRKFGQNVIYSEVSDIVLRAQRYADDDEQVQVVVNQIKGEVAEATVAGDYLLKTAKLELALAEFFRHNRLSAMAIQCWPAIQQMWNYSTCALFGRMTGRGMLTACEVDIIGALSMLVSYQASLGETLPHFVDWTIQHREDENCFLAWHCGNAPVCLAKDPARTALRSRQDMKGEKPVLAGDGSAGLYKFQLRPGKVTFCRLAEYNNEWKMLIAPGEILPSEEDLAGTWAWVKVKNHRQLYRTLVEEGFIHHASMCHGDQVEALKLACKFLNIQAVVVE